MSLEQLMNVNVTVASQLPMTTRESPGILTVLTEEEIRNSGAKDLIDLLHMIPGFDFGVDVEGVIGIGIRGNWGHEGKVLMLWDGMELNEDMYSTLQFGSHYPISQISRIEIIRGPGSAMYGGNAEYAVINVITHQSRPLSGVNAEVTSSHMSRTFGNQSVSLTAGNDLGPFHVNLSTHMNQGNRSQLNYTDRDGESYDMATASRINTIQNRVDVFCKNVSVTGMMDLHSIQQRDGYNNIYQLPAITRFNSYYLSGKYNFSKGNFRFTPGLRLKQNQPWNVNPDHVESEIEPYNVTVKRTEAYLNTSYNTDWLDVVAGCNYYNQKATQNIDSTFFYNGSRNFYLDNYAAYVQGIFKKGHFNFIAGARYNDNSRFNAAFVPRLGITSVYDKWHVKLLYSKAFRAPSIENINVEPGIRPENTIVSEAEIGVKLSPHAYLTANVFDITTHDAIVYFYDDDNADRYRNAGPTGTRGFEMQLKWKRGRWISDFNYSYYSTAGHSVISNYEVFGHPGRLLAFPQHKINANIQIPLGEKMVLMPYASWISDRYASSNSSDGTLSVIRYPDMFYTGISCNYNDLFINGLDLQVGCINLTDQVVYYIQPYNSDHMPLPGNSREFQIKLRYSFEFKK